MNKLYLSTVLVISALLAACGGSTETPNSNAVASNANAHRTANANKIDPIAAQTATPQSTTNNAPTLSPVYKAYCSAWEKKDEQALRSIYSSDTIRDFERQMKEDNVRTLGEFLAEDNASTSLCEARNEKL